jgi:iron-sulfur cluster assembly protein
MNVNITNAACDYIKTMVEKEKGIGLRLSIKKTGCSGYSYLPTIVETENSEDQFITTPNGIKIYIDNKWLQMLDGLKIDYVEEEKSGLKQKRLTFSSPNESGRCGCGESFHVS